MSSHVDIYGVVGSAMLAEELQGRLYRIGVPAYAWSEVHTGLTSAAIQDSDTVAIGISTTGRTEETIEMLAEAGRAGAFTVAITNNPTSPLAELADRSIVTSIYEQFLQPDDLSAKHGQLLVLDLLYLLVAQENFDRSSAKLAASARPCPRIAARVAHRERRHRARRIARWKAVPQPRRRARAHPGRRSTDDEEAVAPVVSDFAERGEPETRAAGQLWPPTEAWTRRSL